MKISTEQEVESVRKVKTVYIVSRRYEKLFHAGRSTAAFNFSGVSNKKTVLYCSEWHLPWKPEKFLRNRKVYEIFQNEERQYIGSDLGGGPL